MLKRIAIVAWWLGTIVAIAVGGGIVSEINEKLDCEKSVTLAKDIDNKEFAWLEHSNKQPGDADPFSALDAIAKDLSSGGYQDPRDSPELRTKVKSCQGGPNFTALFFLPITVALWAVSFIFGGAFWRPPKL